MEKKMVCLLIGLLSMGVIITGCTEPSKLDQPEILKIESRTPDLNATGVAYEDSLSLNFNFPILVSDVGVSDLFAAYGSDHEAGIPDLSSATLEWSTDKKTVTISGIKGWSNLTSGAGPKFVEVITAAEKIRDVYGNVMQAEKVLWKFTLGGRGVFSVYPIDGAVGVPIDTQIKATFSDDMDASTINTDTFTVSGSILTGTVSYDATIRTAIFNPSTLLANSKTYTATMSASVRDVSGNRIGADYTWSFITKAFSAFLLYTKDGEGAGDQFGKSISGVGDVNGDGKDDFIVGAYDADPSGKAAAGKAHVYSGADGSLLYEKDGEAAGDNFGWSVSGVGDVNGDSRDDFMVGARTADPSGKASAGKAYVYSGADGSLLYEKDGAAVGDRLGSSVSGAGDVNGDGRDDFMVGAYFAGASTQGKAYVYSGADGSLLYEKDGEAAGDQFGWSVSGAGDVNGDSRDDFMVGARAADPSGKASAGKAYVYSGADGSLLYEKDGEAAGDYFGNPVSGAGDVNGDGRDDFMVGAFDADPSGKASAGKAYVYSGADGSLLYEKEGAAAGDRLGSSVSGAGDVDGDGKDDFIIGAFETSPIGKSKAGKAYLYSGADGSLIWSEEGESDDDWFGSSVSGAGDVNGDGRDDFMVGADYAGASSQGEVYIYISQ